MGARGEGTAVRRDLLTHLRAMESVDDGGVTPEEAGRTMIRVRNGKTAI